jgi:hypothetical protein
MPKRSRGGLGERCSNQRAVRLTAGIIGASFADSSIENYLNEPIGPAVTKEDPRYYTLGKGGFITRTDAGKNTFNLSEVEGAGAAAGIGNAYYPAQSNHRVKTYQRWGTQVVLDGVFNVLKEFWPDINKDVFHGKY